MRALDLAGLRFGKLVALMPSPTRVSGNIKWRCVCDCGGVTSVKGYSLTTGKCRSCGCEAPQFKDLTGQRFGRLVAVSKLKSYGDRYWKWTCICDCGTTKVVDGRFLKEGKSKSCGCLAKDGTSTIKHGHAKKNAHSTEYVIWGRMIHRCENPNAPLYKDYGGRGIGVCSAWRKSFEVFYRDMGPRPSTKHSIDRIDNDGNYEPGNCRWATQKEQSRNTSRTINLTIGDRTQCLMDWSIETGIKYLTLLQRYHKGWPVERLFQQPKPRKAAQL